MVSLLIKANSPDNVKRLYESAMEMAKMPTHVELVIYVTDDTDFDFKLPRLRYVRGTATKPLEVMQRCYEMAVGPIYGYLEDDMIIDSKDWDYLVKEAFKTQDNRMLFVGGGNDANFDTYGFIHKNWIDTIGSFRPLNQPDELTADKLTEFKLILDELQIIRA